MSSFPTQVDETIPRRAWMALLVSTLVVFLSVINVSSVHVAFPTIRRELGATDVQLSWIVGAYSLVLGSFMLAFGRLADSLGRRRVYLPGVAVFALGSLICATAPGIEWLIVGRLVQGLGGAVTVATGFAVMLPEFPPMRRSTPIGIVGAAGGLGAVTGPVVGSLVIDLASWRGVFWLNVPFCLLVLVIGPRFLSESRAPDAAGRIDWWGVALGTAGIGSIMFAITQSDAWGFADPRIGGLAAAGLLLVGLLVRRSRHQPEPLLDLALFRHRSFTSANIGVVFFGLAFGAGALVSSILLQDVWDLTVRDVGLVLAPGPLLGAVLSPVVGWAADRFGHRWLLVVGCALCALGYTLLAIFISTDAAPWAQYVPLSLVVGMGTGLAVSTWNSAAVADVPTARFGTAAATVNTLRQVSIGLGIAVVVVLISSAGTTPTLLGVQRAYSFIACCFLSASVAVALTFPAGSARDRASALDDRRER